MTAAIAGPAEVIAGLCNRGFEDLPPHRGARQTRASIGGGIDGEHHVLQARTVPNPARSTVPAGLPPRTGNFGLRTLPSPAGPSRTGSPGMKC